MRIENLTLKDIKDIAENKKCHTALEVALANRCLKLSAAYGQKENERNDLFQFIAGVTCRIAEQPFAKGLVEYRKNLLKRRAMELSKQSLDAVTKSIHAGNPVE